MIEAAILAYLAAALVGLVVLTAADAALGRRPGRRAGGVLAVNALFGVAAALAGLVVVVSYVAGDNGRGAPGLVTLALWAGAALALYRLRGFLYAQFELAFASPTRMRLLAVAVACAAPAAAVVMLATARYGI